MVVKLDDDHFTVDVSEVLEKMKNKCEKEKKNVLKNIGKIIMKSVRNNMKWRSGINKSDYVHMQDDIQSKVKTSKYGTMFVEVGGGKNTGYKWRFLNDGAIDQRGNVLVQATHFMEKSLNDSESNINKELDDYLRKVLSNDGNTN